MYSIIRIIRIMIVIHNPIFIIFYIFIHEVLKESLTDLVFWPFNPTLLDIVK